VPNPLPNYDPEYVTNYEIGYKGDLLDSRLRLNLAAFVMEYEDMQISATRSAGGQTAKANLGEATINGLEVELLAMPVERLMLGLNLGWLDDEIDSFRGTLVSSGITIEKDNDLPYTPDWTLALTAGYEMPLAGGATINLRADYSAKDKYYTSIENVVETLEEDYRLLSASVTYTSADDHWSFGLMGRNLTDEDFYQSRTLFESFRMTFGQPVRPRTYSAFVEYRI
jgi:iron complex outermembrane receptor protein